jgi:hypothetical protein
MSASQSLYVKKDRIAGGLTGLLIGDALALPHIGQSVIASSPLSAIDRVPSPTYQRSDAADPPPALGRVMAPRHCTFWHGCWDRAT